MTESVGSGFSVGINTMSYMWCAPARDALEELARAGYRDFELMACPGHFDPTMDQSQARAFARFLFDAGLTVQTVNMPSLDVNLASASREMRDYSVRLYDNLIAIAQTIGARGVITVTGRVNPLVKPPRTNLEGWFGESFERILRTAEQMDIRLMLENIPIGVYPQAEQLIAFADRINSKNVGICYDIANAHFIGEDPSVGLRAVAPKLDIVHLSDTRQQVWRHDPVGQGSCDFAAFGATLREIGYAATSMLEIVADPPVEHIVASHRRLSAWGWAPVSRL